MERTIEEWLGMLPEPYRSKALVEREKTSEHHNANKTAKDLIEALEDGFSWEFSSDGFEYWIRVRDRAEAGEFDAMPQEHMPPDKLSISDHLKAIEGHLAEIRRAMGLNTI